MKKIKYTELAMDDIHPEARNIAVAWIENYQPNNSIMPEIAQKVKLASDIMNFAIAYHKHQIEQLKQHGVMQAEASGSAEGATVGNSAEGKGVCDGNWYCTLDKPTKDDNGLCTQCGLPRRA